MRKIKVPIVVGSIIIAITILSIFTYNRYQSSTFSKVQVQKGSIKEVVSATGKITADEIANLNFKNTGKIVYFPVSENDSVSKGQIVAALDQKVLQNNIVIAKSALYDARTEIDEFVESNQGNLGEPKIIYQKKQLEEKWKQSKVNLDTATQNLQNSSLIAPFDGIVTQANGQINEWVGIFSEEPLVQIVNFSTLYFEAEVEQEDSPGIIVGQKVSINLDAFGDKTLEGEVYEVSRFTTTTTENSIVIPIKIKVLAKNEELKMGLEGDVQIELEQKSDVLLLPKRTLQKDNGEDYVYTWLGSRLIKRPVKVGIFDGRYWEVLEGLDQFDVVAEKKD